MGLEQQLNALLLGALDELVRTDQLPQDQIHPERYPCRPPGRGGSGDLASNAALVLGKAVNKNPRVLGESIAALLRRSADISHVDVAGPGFVNVSFAPTAFHRILSEILAEGPQYGRGRAASGQRVLVEFVSANPTGPLLISHGRGAVLGDVVARLLEVTGCRVTREYYINDFGNQVRLLADSVKARASGKDTPEGGYGGGYVTDLAAAIQARHPELLVDGKEAELSRHCTMLMLEGSPNAETLGIRETLRLLGIEFDVWTSEEGLHRWGRVTRTLDWLAERGRIAEQADGSVVFVTGEDDDKDRVVRKRDGNTTYFASDIAYHHDKISRGFDHLIDVWGADHHGYVARVQTAIAALGHQAGILEVILFQLVSLVRDGKPYRMGKRLGNLITIQEVLEEIDEAVGNPHAGRDAVRFFYLSRKQDTPITLDIELAKRQKSENPVFYVQYGYARLCSILRRASERYGWAVPRPNPELIARIVHPMELSIVAQLGRYGEVLREAAESRDPHRLVDFVTDLAQRFQSYYTQLRNEGDSILPRERDCVAGWEATWDKEKTLARLLWVEAIRLVYGSALGVLGLEAPERMVSQDEDPSVSAV